MQTADELLAAGDLEGARAILVETVRSSAADERARIFLLQLLLVLGEWDKAANQLRAFAQLTPEAQMLATVYNQAILAEQQRAAAFAGTGTFAPLVESPAWLGRLMEALAAYSRGDTAAGEALRDEAFDGAVDVGGVFGERKFERIADVDARFGPCFEAIVGGRWGFIAFESIREMRTEGPKDLRDLVWLPVEVTFSAGNTVACLLPVRYPGTERNANNALKLARGTDWTSGASGDCALGQRQWFTDDGSEMGILDLRRAQFHSASP